jgi:hypothetical protein
LLLTGHLQRRLAPTPATGEEGRRSARRALPFLEDATAFPSLADAHSGSAKVGKAKKRQMQQRLQSPQQQPPTPTPTTATTTSQFDTALFPNQPTTAVTVRAAAVRAPLAPNPHQDDLAPPAAARPLPQSVLGVASFPDTAVQPFVDCGDVVGLVLRHGLCEPLATPLLHLGRLLAASILAEEAPGVASKPLEMWSLPAVALCTVAAASHVLPILRLLLPELMQRVQNSLDAHPSAWAQTLCCTLQRPIARPVRRQGGALEMPFSRARPRGGGVGRLVSLAMKW